jgi:hypothetical protein
MTSAADRIAESFNEHFASLTVRIEPDNVVVGACGTIVEQPSERWPMPSWYVPDDPNQLY